MHSPLPSPTDAASSEGAVDGDTDATIDQAVRQETAATRWAQRDPPWLLESLLSGPDRRLWPAGSLVIGLLGVTTFAICASAAAGVYVESSLSISQIDSLPDLVAPMARSYAYLPFAGAYVSVLFSLQLIVSCKLPLAVRVLLIYGTLYVCMAAVLGNFELPVDPIYVLFAAPLCLGGFIQRRFGRWRATSWNQTFDPAPKITVATLLDATAAIALTMWMVAHADHRMPAAAYLCFLPGSLVFAVLGMHVWARLTTMCDDSSHATSGFAFWMAGNISLGCLVWLTLALSVTKPPQGLRGFIGAVLIVLVAHLWTEIQVMWLRGCGWKLTHDFGDKSRQR